jgi:sulfite reductase (ferredoxin)
MVNTAKAMLTTENVKTNTHISIINDFDEKFVATQRIVVANGFENLALQINKNEPTEAFSSQYLIDTKEFLKKVRVFRNQELTVA